MAEMTFIDSVTPVIRLNRILINRPASMYLGLREEEITRIYRVTDKYSHRIERSSPQWETNAIRGQIVKLSTL